MSLSGHHEVACAILIDTFGRLLFQQRDDIPGILHPGKVGFFGGHREGKESYLECVVREIYEEISYFIPPGRFAHLIGYDEINVDGRTVHSEFFIADDLPVDRLRITEGSLLIVKPEDVAGIEARFSSPAIFAIKAFMNKQQDRLVSRLRT
jgi:8-oxo-dGTP pyrophosphatase MutT (NUDIX family)